ncbi:MAG: RNA methyltransferase [Anaerolineae bacterium]|jgi:TrmH family RNA methyltransferase|nr:RNA methyltransferase [Anaerolineae bacterium]
MITITSTANPRVKYARSLHRQNVRERERCFIAEGARLVADALQARAAIREAFFAEEFAASPMGVRLLPLLQQATNACFVVSPAVMRAMADTVTPQGVLAVVEMPTWPPPKRPRRIGLILDEWRDPGNLGTALRTAEAAGADWVILTPGTVDPFSPKVVRAGMGAHFRLPVFPDRAWDEIRQVVGRAPVYLADARADLPYDRVDWTRPSVLVIGGEARGAGEGVRTVEATPIAIPMMGCTESLNAAVAASVILMEALRQRRCKEN